MLPLLRVGAFLFYLFTCAERNIALVLFRNESWARGKKMNVEKCVVRLSLAAVVGAFVAGCASMREVVEKEYARVVALPPAERVFSPNKAVDDVARLSFDVYNYSHSLLKEYVAATENHREFTGFMNDIKVVMEEENLSEEDAMAKVCALVQEEDKARPDAEKVWPRIVEGWAAANALDPVKKLAEIARLVIRNADIVASAANLPNAIANEPPMGKIQRGAESAKIIAQATQTTEILAFLAEQFRRVQMLKIYQK